LTIGVTYDTGALLAGERNDRRIWRKHLAFLALDLVPTVPAPVLAEAWRGRGRQAALVRLLSGCSVEPLTEPQALRVGALAGRAKHSDIVDVTVVEGALRRGDAIITSDPTDIEAIARAAAGRPHIVAI